MIQYFKCVKGINTVNWFNPNTIANSVGLFGPAGNIRGSKHRIDRQFLKKNSTKGPLLYKSNCTLLERTARRSNLF